MILTAIIVYAIVLSGCWATKAFFSRRPEEGAPLTIFAVMAALYIFCAFKLLSAGALIILICFIVLDIYMLCSASCRLALKSLFSPAMVLFSLIFIFLIYINYGKLLSTWGEFSHWATTVKDLVYFEDFSANPAALSDFKSYPPAMSLWQYVFQYINTLLKPSERICEWGLYFSYQLACFSLFVPFMGNLSFKKPLQMSLCALALVFSPYVIFIDYPSIYRSIEIDTYLSFVFAYCVLLILLSETYDGFFTLCLSGGLFILVLTKEAGLLFAVFALLLLLIELLFKRRSDTGSPLGLKALPEYGKAIACFAGAMLLAWLSWKLILFSRGAGATFPREVDLAEFVKIVIGQITEGYRVEVYHNYIAKFFYYDIIRHLSCSSAIVLFLLIMLSFLLLSHLS
ncbi:MAG: hypothetical protein Q4B42_07915, partial [Oscillospiraceae bacterium]|nr:hypothetical protein [Oscillospiraceae bacterium]